MLNLFIWRHGALRGAAHWLIMWGCLLASAITFPLVFGWIHFGIVSVAAQLRGFPVVAQVLLSLNIVFYVALWALTLLRVFFNRRGAGLIPIGEPDSSPA